MFESGSSILGQIEISSLIQSNLMVARNFVDPLLQFSMCILLLAGCWQKELPEREFMASAGISPTDTLWLFDGHSFAGWNGVNDFFRIEDGSVVAGRLDRNIPQNEFLCTDARYSDFKLHFQTRMFVRERMPASSFERSASPTTMR